MAENEVGRVSLGVELSTDPLSSQAADLERKVTSIAEKAGEKAGKKFADEAAKAFERNSDKIGEAGEKAGEEAGKGAGKGLKSGSRSIESETGEAGEKAGKSFFSRFQKHASGAGSGLKSIAAKIGKALVAAFATKKLFDFGKYAVNMGSDLNEVQNVVDSTFGQGSKSQKAVNDFAKNAATQFGLSETMAKRYAGTFGAMGKAFGFTGDQAADMSTTLTGLAGDVASFYNITQDEAYTKLKSVFTGETESLKDLGVVMTQAALDQYALQHGFGQTTKTMSEQEKVALRYSFVLDRLSTASGDFARTSDSWANQVRLLKLQFESLAATVGQVLIAALTPAIKALNSFMGVLVKAANTFKSFVFSLFGLEASAMGTGSAGALPEALGNIGDSAGGAADSLGDVGDAAKGAGKDASKAADEIKRSLASFDKITKLTDQSSSSSGSSGSSGGSGSSGSSGSSGGTGGTGGIGSLGDTSSALTNTAWSIGDSGGPLDKVIAKLKTLKNLFANGFWEGFGDDTGVFDRVRTHIENIGKTLKGIFTDSEVDNAATECTNKIIVNLGRVSGASVSIGATLAENLFGGVDKYLTQHEEDIKKALVRVFTITGEISEIVGTFATDFAEVFEVFRSPEAQQCTANIINIFATTFDTILETGLKFGRDVLSAITKPFTDNKELIAEALTGSIGRLETVTGSISGVFETLSKTIGTLYDDHIGPLINSLGEGVSEIVGTVLEGWNTHISPVLNQLTSRFSEVCESHISPLIESLGRTAGTFFDLVRTFWESILQPLINTLVEHLMPIIGKIVEVMGNAFLTAITVVSDAFRILSEGIQPVITFVTNLIKKIGEFKPSDIAKGIGDIAGKAKELPGKIVMTVSAVKDKAWDTVTGAYEKIKNSEAVKTIKGAASSAWTTVKGAWEDVKDGTALKTLKGLKEQSFASAIDAFDAVKNSDAVKTIKGAASDAWSNVKKSWENLKDGTALKTIKGKTAQAFFNVRKAFNGLKNNAAIKTIRGKSAPAFHTVRRAFNALKSSDAVKTVKGKINQAFWNAKSNFGKLKSEGITKFVKGKVEQAFWNAKSNFGKLKSEGITKSVKGAIEGAFWNAKSAYEKIKDNTVVKTMSGKLSSAFYAAKDAWNKIKDTTVYKTIRASLSGLSSAAKRLLGLANGGVYKNGHWHPIQSFAGGGSPNGGQVFRARENGNPELVGTLKGSTAVMNNDQIVASVSSGVARAISGIRFYSRGNNGLPMMEAYLPHLADIGNGIRTDTAQLAAYAKQIETANNNGNNTEIITLLEQILRILSEMDPDIYIDGQKVTDKIVSIINARTRATGRSAVIV